MSDDLPLGFVSLADHIAELRRDPERAKALDEAREPVLRDIVRALLDRLADRDALAAENARLREAMRRWDDGEPICPFDRPTSIKYDEPCPVCGDLGSTPLDEGRCVHNPYRLAAPKEST